MFVLLQALLKERQKAGTDQAMTRILQANMARVMQNVENMSPGQSHADSNLPNSQPKACSNRPLAVNHSQNSKDSSLRSSVSSVTGGTDSGKGTSRFSHSSGETGKGTPQEPMERDAQSPTQELLKKGLRDFKADISKIQSDFMQSMQASVNELKQGFLQELQSMCESQIQDLSSKLKDSLHSALTDMNSHKDTVLSQVDKSARATLNRIGNYIFYCTGQSAIRKAQ